MSYRWCTTWCASTSRRPPAGAGKPFWTCGTCIARSSGRCRQNRRLPRPRRKSPRSKRQQAFRKPRTSRYASAVRALGVGLLGLGTVGSGVANVLLTKREALERRIGRPVRICKVLVRDVAKPRGVEAALPLVTQASEVIDDPEVDVVVEVLGGEEPARTLILQAIERGKHVVTANKEVMAKHGPTILAAAASKGVGVAYEASVGGGIP